MAVAVPVFVTERSADEATAALVVAVLFAATESGVEAEITAVLLMVLPDAADDAARTTSVNVADVPFTRAAAVHVTVPVAPAAGVVQVKPVPIVIDTNVVPVGRASVNVTAAASDGPLFVVVIV